VRSFGLVLCVAVIGCVPPGLTLEVTTSDPNVARVELFVAMSCDGTCPGSVAPPGLSPKATEVYLVTDPVPWSARVSDGVAGFELRADRDQHVSIVLAVGFDAADNARAVATLHDVLIPASEVAHWQMPLITTAVLDDTPPAGERIAVWREPSAPALACVMVEHGTSKRDLVVPRKDTDCDSLAIGECAPWTHLAPSSPGPIESASCLLAAENGSQLCRLGGPTCSEVGGTTRACALLDQEYCAPSAFCLVCAPWNVDCINAQIQSSTSMPSIACDLPLAADGSPCGGSSETRVGIDARPFLGLSPTRCKDITFNDVGTPLGMFSHSTDIDNASLDFKNVNNDCSFELALSGTITQGSRSEPFLADLALDNGKHLMIPLRVNLIVGECVQQPRCMMTVTPDPMFECAQVAGTSPCAPQMIGCRGPSCGTVCCGLGEQCVGGQCRCGAGSPCQYPYVCAAMVTQPQCGSMCCDDTAPVSTCEF